MVSIPYVSNTLSELMSPTPIFGIKTKSSNLSIFVSINVIKISSMNYVEIYLKKCVLILSIVQYEYHRESVPL